MNPLNRRVLTRAGVARRDTQSPFGGVRLYSELGVNVPLPPGLPEGPSLMTLLQEDLGLKLDSQRGPGEVLVIDSAELPTPD